MNELRRDIYLFFYTFYTTISVAWFFLLAVAQSREVGGGVESEDIAAISDTIDDFVPGANVAVYAGNVRPNEMDLLGVEYGGDRGVVVGVRNRTRIEVQGTLRCEGDRPTGFSGSVADALREFCGWGNGEA